MLNFARSGIKDPYLPAERPSVFSPTSRVEAVPIISLIFITDIAMPLCSSRCNSFALRSLWQSTLVELIVKKISLLCLSLAFLSLVFSSFLYHYGIYYCSLCLHFFTVSQYFVACQIIYTYIHTTTFFNLINAPPRFVSSYKPVAQPATSCVMNDYHVSRKEINAWSFFCFAMV